MKRKITLLFTAAVCAVQLNAQVALNESFTAPFTPSASGWVTQNNSVPQGTVSWFQGNSNAFPALSGGPSDYYAVNYQSQGSASGGISNWLITPTVTIYNGAVFQFATATVTDSPVYPDRLQLTMSTAGTATSVGTGTTGVGTFTDVLLDINPLLSTNTSSAVNNGTVNGYPQQWTVYSVTITGQPTPVVGRFAFHYLVDDGGPSGANSDYIGIDDVNYSLPCGATVASYTTCAGTTSTLMAVGGLGTTTYSWNTGATTSSITVSPVSTTVYTLTSMYPGGTCPTPQTATITTAAQMAVNAVASSSAVCSGNSATLTAMASATSYSWLPSGQGGASIVVSPTAATVYTVVAQNGACFGGATVALGVNAAPTASAASSSMAVCTGQSFTLTGSGSAASYVWMIGSTTFTSNPIALSSTIAATYNFTLVGTGANGCTASAALSQTVANCTAIENNNANVNTVSVYPNPFTTELKISGVNGSVEIFNTLGQLVATSAVNENETINTSNLAKGVYIVKTYNAEGKEVKTIRVIKN
ncbi:MAG: choice-of-anchor J domain-containing protein [Bacteroidia bacterium]